MFDLLPKLDYPCEYRPSSNSSFLKSNPGIGSMRPQDTKVAWMSKVDEEGHGVKTCKSDVEDDDGLELSLGLSIGGSSSKLKRTAELLKGASGISRLRSDSPMPLKRESSKGELSAVEQPVDLKGSQSTTYLKNDHKASEACLPQTRDQVWEALQKGNFLVAQETMHVEGAAPLQELKHASASLGGRRSSSMQSIMGLKEVSEGASHAVRRLSSNGASVHMNVLSQQYDCAPTPLSRQVSSVESLLERSNEAPTTCSQRQEAWERQRKIEQQALRRQEARRRRKCLIVEKQHKKARKDDQCLSLDPRTFASVSPQKVSPTCGDSQDSLNLLNQVNYNCNLFACKLTTHATSDKSGVVCPSRARIDSELVGVADLVAEGRLKPLDLAVRKASTVDRKCGDATVDEHTAETEALPGSNSCVGLHSYYSAGMDQDCITHEKVNVMCPPSSQGAVPGRKKFACLAAERDFPTSANVAVGKVCNSSTSESESGDTNEEHSTVQNDCGEIEALSGKHASTEGSQSGGSGVSFASMNSLAYPPPFPVVPIPYPIPVAGATPGIPLQLGFSLPCFMQYPTSGGGESSIPPSSQLSASFPVHGSATLPPYRFPVPDGSYPWFPIVPTGTATSQTCVSQSSKGSPVATSSRNELKDEQHLEGPRQRLEDTEVSPLSDSLAAPISNTTAKSFAKDQTGTSLPSSPVPVDCQAPAPVSKRKTAAGRSSTQHGNRKDSTSVSWNLTIERQHSLPVSTRMISDDTGSAGQSSFRTLIEGHSSHVAVGESQCENGLRAKKFGSCGSRNLASASKQDEVSAESQLASENSGQEVSIEQPAIGGQNTASIPELPWVSTTGVGPNGKTISGVMYISSRRQIRLVCSCHGKNMSPAEFVEHSGSIDLSNPERNILVNPFPFLRQVATTPV